ncbi:MAG TPA: hypothetical protein VK610_05695 [Rhodothermales bacterium]|nr:hypothetical protein [Rhodothermales bacterium]
MYRLLVLPLLVLAACHGPAEVALPIPPPGEVMPPDTLMMPLPALDADENPCFFSAPTEEGAGERDLSYTTPSAWVPLRAATPFRVRDDLPALSVAYVGEEEWLFDLPLTRTGEAAPFQTLELDGAPFYSYSDMQADALDVNGDGYADLRFATATGTGYLFDYVWLYEPEHARFGGLLMFGDLDVDPVSGGVTSGWKSGAAVHGVDLYRFEGRRPVLVRQWVTLAMDSTFVCEPRDGEMVVREVRPGWDWHDVPGEEE